MAWLVPSVISTIISMLVLSFAYLILSYIEREKYLWIWFFAWILSTLRFAFMLLFIYYPEINIYSLLNLNFSLYSGILLYWGTIYWLKLDLKKPVIILGFLLSVNSVVGAYINTGFFYQAAPIFFFLGIVNINLGWKYLRQKESSFNILMGVFFILWGLHKLDYPFIRQITFLAPWGYILGTTLTMLTAVSMILLYLIRTKKSLVISNKELQLDIQERKKIELENKNQIQITEEATAIKNNFLANISHELRTPLNGAIGMIELLKNLDQTEESSYYLELATQSVDRLFSTIKDLLDFVQIDSGKLGLIIESFDFKKMINNSIEVFKPVLEEKELSVTFKNLGNKNIFIGDKARLAQIIISLLSNAVKFSEKGIISISYLLNSNLEISISDEGIGIAENDLENIFKTLQQLEDPYTKQFEGLGMGLAIVKNLIDLMNGNLIVTSELGKGTTFKITIPESTLVNKQTEFEKISPHDTVIASEDFTILIAEDEGINRVFIREILKKNKYPVIEAKNGSEVLDLLKTHDPELIIMDINMPVLSGLDAAIELRKIKKFNNTPILALTAYTGENDILKFLSAGFNEVLEKPIDEYNLIEKIKEYAG